MKKLVFIIVISGLIFTNCSSDRDDIPKLNFNEKAFIKIIAENNFDSVTIKTNYSSFFPLQPCLIHQILIKEKGAYYTSYRITRPDFVEIAIQDSSFYIYMIPTDTVVINVGIVENLKGETSIYHVIDDPINRYLQKESKNFGSLYFRSPVVEKYYNSSPTSQKELDKAISKIDSAQTERLVFLENNMNGLPKWFINTQKSDYVYLSADLKYFQNFYFQNTHLMGKYPVLNVNTYNPEAILSSYYYRFISDYFLLTFSDKKNEFSGPLRMIDLYNSASSDIESNLKGDILSYFKSCLLASLYKASDQKREIDSVDKFVQSRDFGLSDVQKAYINQERLDILKPIEKQFSLKIGDKAPEFELLGIDNKKHRLSEFEGKTIYLHFWATWCAPCLAEMPVLNQLITDLNTSDLVVLNVCIDNEPDKWRQIIKDNGLQGLNLICDEPMSRKITSLYKISSLPHYALIDVKGLIIKNNCERPAHIDKEISQLMAEK